MPAREALLRDVKSVKQSLRNTHYQVELGNELRVGISGTYTVVNVKTLQHDTFKDNDYARHLSKSYM